jgi:hypothetical protein
MEIKIMGKISKGLFLLFFNTNMIIGMQRKPARPNNVGKIDMGTEKISPG